MRDLISLSPVRCERCTGSCRAILINDHTLMDRCETCAFIWIDREELPSVLSYVRAYFGSRRIPRHLETMMHDPKELRRASKQRAVGSAHIEPVDATTAIALVLEFLLG